MAPTEDENEVNQEITVRRLEEKDAAAVADIWANGLQQTVDELWRIFQPLIRYMFDKSKEEAMAEDGEMGPQGKHLCKNWCEDAHKVFFVAVIKEKNGSKDDEEGTEKVVGCVGVKRGSGPKALEETDTTSTTASIWRLSVDEAYRRRGIASKLMEAAEAWGLSIKCDKMWLMTANPRGKDFYKRIGYETDAWHGTWFLKQLMIDETTDKKEASNEKESSLPKSN